MAAQLVLLAALAFCPAVPAPSLGSQSFVFPIGWAAAVAGMVLCLWAAIEIRRSLTPLPAPTGKAELKTYGAFGIVRHPIYLGLILGGLGYSLIQNTSLALILVLCLAVVLDRKAAFEETLLLQRFEEYPAYQKRVRKLIPFLY